MRQVCMKVLKTYYGFPNYVEDKDSVSIHFDILFTHSRYIQIKIKTASLKMRKVVVKSSALFFINILID